MSDKKNISLDDAYAIETPEDSIRLYERWAETYDEDFVEANAYIAFLHIADEMARRRDEINGPVLDVGCGTGVVGIALRERGIGPVDGVDISKEMLAVSGRKQTTGGEPVWHGDEYVGFTTSGAYGHSVGKSLAMGYLSSSFLDSAGGGLEVHLVDGRRPARILTEAPYDPAGDRMRG